MYEHINTDQRTLVVNALPAPLLAQSYLRQLGRKEAAQRLAVWIGEAPRGTTNRRNDSVVPVCCRRVGWCWVLSLSHLAPASSWTQEHRSTKATSAISSVVTSSLKFRRLPAWRGLFCLIVLLMEWCCNEARMPAPSPSRVALSICTLRPQSGTSSPVPGQLRRSFCQLAFLTIKLLLRRSSLQVFQAPLKQRPPLSSELAPQSASGELTIQPHHFCWHGIKLHAKP